MFYLETYVKTDCDFKNKCKSYGSYKCQSCKKNKNRQHDYYEPISPAYPSITPVWIGTIPCSVRYHDGGTTRCF